MEHSVLAASVYCISTELNKHEKDAHIIMYTDFFF